MNGNVAGWRIAFMTVALLPPALACWILWLAPVDGLTADRTALAARDFTALWTAGRIAAQHATGILSDPAAFTEINRAWFGPGFPDQIWPYPPPILLLAAPLSLLPLGTSFVLYTTVALLMLWLALRAGGLRRVACAAVLLSPAVADSALAGQNGSLTAALLVGGLLLVDRRPATAGVLLGALVLKPQFALLLPVCLVAGQRWRTLAFAAVASVSLTLASALLFGTHFWTEYLARAQPAITTYLETPWDGRAAQRIFASAFMAARALGASLPLAYAMQAAFALFCAVLAWRAWRLPKLDPQLRMGLTAALAVAASPWVHSYDMPAFAASVVVLLPRVPRIARPMLALAWFWPGTLSILPLPPVLPVASVAGVVWLAWRQVAQDTEPIVRGRSGHAGAAVVLCVLAVVAPSRFAKAQDDARVCDAAAAKAEADWNVPAGVLAAVGTVESGRGGRQFGNAPWPWTINAAGRGAYFRSKAEAIAAVLALMSRGYPYIDVGCFQIDLGYHPGVFLSLDDAFDPDRNAQAAAQILATERLRAGDWAAAVARYHSAAPMLGGPYLDRVRAALPQARTRATYALFERLTSLETRGADANPPIPLESPSLPTVLYLRPIGRAAHEPQIIFMGRSGRAYDAAQVDFQSLPHR